MLAQVRQVLHLLGPDQRGRWLLVIVVALVASGLEIVGAALVYLLLALVADPGGEAALPLVGDVRRLFGGTDEQTQLLTLAAAMGVFFLLRAAFQVGQSYLQNRVAHRAGARLSRRLVTGYFSMPYAFHLGRNSSELIRNGHQAVDQLVSLVLIPAVRVTAEAVLVVAMLAFLLVVSPVATGLAVLVIGAAAILLLRVIQPRLQQLGWTAHEMNGETLRSLQQGLEGVRDVKMLGRERAFAEVYGRARDELARVTYLAATATALPRTVVETSLVGLILVIFSVAVAGGAATGGTLSVLGLFAYAGLRLQPSLQSIIAGLNNLRFASVPLEALHRDFQAIERDADLAGDEPPIPFERALVAEGVSFRYDSSATPALRDVELTLRPGEAIGICGPTGSGKTTLVDVLTGLLPPTTGRVTVDGRDLREHVRGWQRNLGTVPQNVFLTDDTLRNNIALGIDEADVDEEAVRDAVRSAQLEAFVASLPDGLDTVLGERGVRMSGGQRQRVAIARALYRRPEVLVLDEGTSALDNTTEAALMGALQHLRGAHTIVMIAHRLSTVRDCDRVVYLEDGRVEGVGTFEELAATSPSFRRMVSQAG